MYINPISIANPISGKEEGYFIALDNGEAVTATPEMCSRMTPAIGDYWVIQSDGYTYLNPKNVFERKYSPAPQDEVIRPGNPYFGHISPADKPVVPGLEGFELVYAKDQPQYIPLRTLRSEDEKCEVLSRWSPNTSQRKGIADGADIFLTLLTFRDKEGKPNPLQPIRMFVADNPNPDYFREAMNLKKTAQDAWNKVAPTIKEAVKSSDEKRAADRDRDDRMPQPDRRHGSSAVPPGPPAPPPIPGKEVG